MSSLFSAEFINGHFEDPGLFVSFLFQKRAMLFDLGDIHSLSERDLLRIERVFVTHTHVDHFAGFERLLRVMLGRDKTVCFYGPKGFIKNVEGKLAGYNWNLVRRYKNNFIIKAYEVLEDRILLRSFVCKEAFKPVVWEDKSFSCGGVIYEDEDVTVRASILDHGIECLGFALEEKLRVNVIKERLTELGLAPGPWISEFKKNFIRKISGGRYKDKAEADNNLFDIEFLADKIARVNFGKKLGYVTDVKFTKENVDRIVPLVRNADFLFIEAVFADKDGELGALKNHLTAKQAGSIAKLAKAKKIFPFHFSRRYKNQKDLLVNEAVSFFMGAADADLS